MSKAKKAADNSALGIGLERKNTRQNSMFSANYYAWIAMIFSIVIWYKFDTNLQPGTLGNTANIYRIVLVAGAGLFAIHGLFRNVQNLVFSVNTPIIMLFIYGIVAFLSSLLVPENAFYSMWKSIEINIDVLAMIGILAASRSVNGPLTAYRWLMIYNTIMLVFVVVGAFISPAEAFRPSRGVIPYFIQGHTPILNPNTVGFICVQLVIHNLAVFIRSPSRLRKYLAIIFFLISVATLIFAQSRTATAGMLLGLITYLYFDNKRLIAASLVILGSIVMLFTSGAEMVSDYLQRGQSVELMTSLSGRTHGWNAAWEMFQQSPWTGHGFAAAARTEILGTGSSAASTLHGAFFDVIVGVGVFGAIPWVIAIILLLNRMMMLTVKRRTWIRDQSQRSIHAEFCAITVVLAIRAATSSGISMHDHAFMLLLCIIGYAYTATLSSTKNQKQQHGQPSILKR